MQLRGGLDLLVEAGDVVGTGELLLAEELESDDPLHVQMPGLEDLAHSALAEAVEKDVGANEQILALVCRDLRDLEASQPAALQDDPRQHLRIRIAGLRQALELR